MKNIKPVPRLFLSNLYTPIEECHRINQIYPYSSKLYIKRDDFIGSLVWGNKLRKLEFSIADALKQNADTIITCGAVQSNHARITAQICKRLGLNCILVFNGKKPDIPTGNQKINNILNVPLYFVETAEERDNKMKEIHQQMKEKGYSPYIIPLGASDSIGCLGIAEAMNELKEQQNKYNIKFDYIVHASSSGGTQAGMELGKRIYSLNALEIIGISVDRNKENLSECILNCTTPAIERLQVDFKITKNDLNIETDYIGAGYAIPSKESEEAKRFFLENEGIFLDSVYTAKAAAYVIDLCRSGKIKKEKNILFWHTGGLMAMF